MDLSVANSHLKHAIRVSIEISLITGAIDANFVAVLMKLPDVFDDLVVGKTDVAVNQIIDVSYVLVDSAWNRLTDRIASTAPRYSVLDRNKAMKDKADESARIDKVAAKAMLVQTINYLLGVLTANDDGTFPPLPISP